MASILPIWAGIPYKWTAITAFGFALFLTIGAGAFLWQQFGEMLVEVQQKGPSALDLDR